MENQPSLESSKPEHELLAHLIRELQAASRSPAKPRWQVFLESAGGAALITVVVGGLIAGGVGSWITNRYQQKLKEDEIASKAYNDYLSQGNTAIIEALGDIGGLLSTSNDLFQLAKPEWQSASVDAGSRAELQRARAQIIGNFNSAHEKWGRDRDRHELLINYYHQGDASINRTWSVLQDATEKYSDCVQLFFFRAIASNATNVSPDGCRAERATVDASLVTFINARHDAARRQATKVVAQH